MNEKKINCPFCAASLYVEKKIFSSILNLPGNTKSRVVSCNKCDGLYLQPYITDTELSLMYGESYFTGNNSSVNGFDIPASEEDFDSVYSASRKQKFNDTLIELKSMKPDAKTILDVGAATGDFLAIALDYGLEVEGIELSNYAAEMAMSKYGLNFKRMNVIDYNSKFKFDLIHLNHVFEHSPNPRLVVEKLSNLTNLNGLVYIEVPYQFNLIEILKHKIFGWRQPFNVFSLHHPVFYRPNTLVKVMVEHGFECCKIRLFKNSRYKKNSLTEYVKSIIWQFLSLFGQGIQIEAIFRRTDKALK